MSDTARPTHEECVEKAKGQYVFLGDYCGRVERVDGGTLIIRFDDHALPGKVREAHEHFHPLHEQGTEVPAERIWADGASVRITAYQFDPKRRVIRMKTERAASPAGARTSYNDSGAPLLQLLARGCAPEGMCHER